MSVTKDGVLMVQPVRFYSTIPDLRDHFYDSRGSSCWTCSLLPASRCARPITEMSLGCDLFRLYLEKIFLLADGHSFGVIFIARVVFS
jgi:hypothetical protein